MAPYSYNLTSQALLRLVGLVFLIAFTSYWVQLPGLYGNDGLEPAEPFLQRQERVMGSRSTEEKFLVMPTLLWLHDRIGLTVSEMLTAVTLTGMSTSLLMAVGCNNLLITAATWLLYLSLYAVGQTFLSFQWDILLLEVGWAAVLLAPLPGSLQAGLKRSGLPPPVLLLRWVLFKLMFMSGVVKIQALCPTWLKLTACHYHFASQCIPTPASWYGHQLPDLLLKLSVAGTYVIEIPAPFLVLVPFRPVRLLAAALQVFLQLNIIVTGNYNFFNLLTCVLCVSLLDDQLLAAVPGLTSILAPAAPAEGTAPAAEGGKRRRQQAAPAAPAAPAAAPAVPVPAAAGAAAGPADSTAASSAADAQPSSLRADDESSTASEPLPPLPPPPARPAGLLQTLLSPLQAPYRLADRFPTATLILCLAPVIWSTLAMFRLTSKGGKTDLELAITPEQLQAWVDRLLAPTIIAWGAVLAAAVLVDAAAVVLGLFSPPPLASASRAGLIRTIERLQHLAGHAMRTSVLLLWVAGTGAVLLGTYAAGAPAIASLSPNQVAKEVREWPQVMQLAGWAQPWHLTSGYGLFRRMTGVGDEGQGASTKRPELEVFGSYDGTKWKAIRFRYKPGDIRRSPPWIMPHQARLDWQMWFAALGSYHQTPWLLHLVVKLFDGGEALWPLLDPASPFVTKPPKFIKIDLYHYDFTRAEWGRNRTSVKTGGPLAALKPVARAADDVSASGGGASSSGQALAQAWWVRKRVSGWLPVIKHDDPQLRGVLRQEFGWGPVRKDAGISSWGLFLKGLQGWPRLVLARYEQAWAWAQMQPVEAVWAVVVVAVGANVLQGVLGAAAQRGGGQHAGRGKLKVD